ncbi:MAG: hypothetical protein A2X86_18970 [Bdellovibrionales bacterium GWA2_49_15]|nr:MAG: hypothetical protein A2X86_18970 [Bdellovibrionales bacterium GWA2_49_15]HAZ14309.1 hypothetical protein [Bdellovibrionales bacterium]
MAITNKITWIVITIKPGMGILESGPRMQGHLSGRSLRHLTKKKFSDLKNKKTFLSGNIIHLLYAG